MAEAETKTKSGERAVQKEEDDKQQRAEPAWLKAKPKAAADSEERRKKERERAERASSQSGE